MTGGKVAEATGSLVREKARVLDRVKHVPRGVEEAEVEGTRHGTGLEVLQIL